MKIPSEAELIEMERRALILPRVAEYLRRKAENQESKADRADSVWKETQFLTEARRLQQEADSIEQLSRDIDSIVELARSVRAYADHWPPEVVGRGSAR